MFLVRRLTEPLTGFGFVQLFKTRANGRNIVGSNTLRPFAWNHNNIAYSLKPVKLLAQQVPTFPLFYCSEKRWARLHGATIILTP